MERLNFKVPPKRANCGRYFCGPFAICAITGQPYESVRAVINQTRGRNSSTAVTGMYNIEVTRALQEFGYQVKRLRYFDRMAPTLAAWLRSRKGVETTHLLLVQLTKHYVLVRGRKFIDNHTHKPVWLREAPHRRSRVKNVFLVTPRAL